LKANKRKQSSEIWKAILFGREALWRGLIKRVGPGSSISIWEDNWIPSLRQLKPIVHLEGVQVQFVDELFQPGTRCWNVDLVRKSFVAMDAEEILKLRPGTRMDVDVMGWAHEKNGVFSIRSCYRMLKQTQSVRKAHAVNAASSSNEECWWSKLWKLDIPPKIRIFWWRVLHNYLPSKQELKRRHILRENFCEVCGGGRRIIFHIAIDCLVAKQFWRVVKNITGVKLPVFLEVTWAKDLLADDHFTDSVKTMVICGAWSLWSGRNARRFGRDCWNPYAVVSHVAKMLEDLVCLKLPGPQASLRCRVKWKAPLEGWVKINSDDAFVAEMGKGAEGVVMRNSQGEVLVAAAQLYEHIPDALTSGALAARDGVVLAQMLSMEKVILEVDNSVLVALLRSEEGRRSAIAGLWQEIRERSVVFRSFDVSFVNREGNEVAHLLCKQGYRVGSCFILARLLP
jgi:hypothetical protein